MNLINDIKKVKIYQQENVKEYYIQYGKDDWELRHRPTLLNFTKNPGN